MWEIARKWALLIVTVAVVASSIGNPSGEKRGFSVDYPRRQQLLSSTGNSSLFYDFYRDKCPQADQIIRSAMADFFSDDPSVAPGLLRLLFHDCFIQGCDASVLLNSVDGNSSEKDAVPNQTIRGYEVIDAIKSKLEKACPATVSCADIVVIAARDALVMAGGPFYPLLTGRRDSLRSYFNEATTELPSPTENLTQTLSSFNSRGFDERETVSLLGAHSIGSVHCRIINQRLHDFRNTGSPDPTLDPDFLRVLQARCNSSDTASDDEPRVEMDADRRSSAFFHTHYYQSLLKGQGLLHADQQLMASTRTASLVAAYASDDGSAFRRDFARAMIKLSSIGVLSGAQGQVRLNCSIVLVG